MPGAQAFKRDNPAAEVHILDGGHFVMDTRLDEVAAITGHPVGGVCPFGLASPLPVYCDVSLKDFDMVVPAAGSTHSSLFITPQRMAELTGATWVDICQPLPESG